MSTTETPVRAASPAALESAVAPVSLTVNGQARRFVADGRRSLLDVLRNDLDLRGSHFGCGAGECGACMVLVEGHAVPACDTPLWSVDGKAVVTVEGLGSPAAPHPLQQAFVAEQAAQCGYCTSGMLVSGVALLNACERPDDTQIRAAMERNLCRCGTHPRVMRAIARCCRAADTSVSPELMPDAAPAGAMAAQPGRTRVALDEDSLATATVPTTPAGLPRNLRKTPRLSAWLRIDPAGHAEVRSGKVEIGQGILTALAQIAAEELGLAFDQVRMRPAATGASPDEAVTSGSLSVQDSGSAIRHVCAQARGVYLQRAAQRHAMPLSALRIARGVIYAGDVRLCSYWDIADDALLDVDAAGLPGSVVPRDTTQVVGRSIARPDIDDKVHGRYVFVHDLVLPGMAHGRMLRPPSPSARLRQLASDEVAAWPGVLAVRRDGSLVGVVARTEAQAERAMARLAELAVWDEAATLPDETRLADWLRQLPRDTTVLADTATAIHSAAQTVRASYSKPFLKHASIGTSCALARIDDDGRLEVWTHSQGIYNLQRDLALALDRPADGIVVRHVQGAGCYGHNGADDVAFDAAWLARACPGIPVRVLWSRADELCWSPLSPAMAVDIEADLDPQGRVLAWREEVYSPGHGLRPGRAATSTLLGSWHLAAPHPRQEAVNASLADGGGSERNAVPLYDFASVAVRNHRVLQVPMRTSAMRALGAFANVFAIESFMDELAFAAGQDPLAYRLAYLRDPRAVAVLQAAASAAGWADRPPMGEGRGHGLGVARYKGVGAYCAVVAEVELTHEVRVKYLHVAVDVGQVINPDGVRQQIEGGAIQATSWALLEAARFDTTRVTSASWTDYPILRFSQAPAVDVHLVQHDGHPPVGAGEASLGPAAAAIGNAVFHALGVRVRDLPISPARIVEAMP